MIVCCTVPDGNSNVLIDEECLGLIVLSRGAMLVGGGGNKEM